VGMNKNDIMDIAREIGTYDAAAAMPEYCWVVSQRPETKAQLQDILDAEENLSKDILEKAHWNRFIQRVSDMLFSDDKTSSIPEIQQAWDEIIIDLREEERVKKSPLTQKWIEGSVWIPFYEINHTFAKLDQDKQYLLYCDKWVLSHLHGLYLKEKWFTNIKVLRP
jgi:thiamine biosynthesis protein ThiI